MLIVGFCIVFSLSYLVSKVNYYVFSMLVMFDQVLVLLFCIKLKFNLSRAIYY